MFHSRTTAPYAHSLSSIHIPRDLKLFSPEELTKFFPQISSQIPDIEQISTKELTLSLHYLFDPNHDTFVFEKRASTTFFRSLGLATSRDLCEEEGHVIALVEESAFPDPFNLELLCLPHLKRFITILMAPLNSSRSPLTDILKDRTRGENYLSQYGFSYVGPIRGDDLSSLIQTLSSVKNKEEPYLLYVQGGTSFTTQDEEKPKSPSVETTFSDLLGSYLLKLATEDPSIITVTPGQLPKGSFLSPLMQTFPHRCKEMSITESQLLTFAGALAQDPRNKVLCTLHAPFLVSGFDSLLQDICLQKAPVIFALDRAGLNLTKKGLYHGIYDISFLQALPHMVICQPRDGDMLKELLESAFDWELPVAMRYLDIKTTQSPSPLERRQLGKGEILKEGKEIAIIALGHMCSIALEVAYLLEGEGLYPTVVDPVFIKPLDSQLCIDLFVTHSCIVTLEEHAVSSGLGCAINLLAAKQGFSLDLMINIGIEDIHSKEGSRDELLPLLGLDAPSIAKAILKKAGQAKLLSPSP